MQCCRLMCFYCINKSKRWNVFSHNWALFMGHIIFNVAWISFHSDWSSLPLSLWLFGRDWSMCQVWWGIMALERFCSSVMWLQQMAQLSIRVGSPAVCSPASCFTAIKYHQGRARERGKEQGKEGGRWRKRCEAERESRSQKDRAR